MDYYIKCPECGGEMSWTRRWELTSFYGTRRTRPCPHCGVSLRQTRLPHVTANLLLLSWIILCAFEIAGILIIPRFLKHLVLGLFCGMMFTPLALKFETVEPKTSEPDAADSGEGNGV